MLELMSCGATYRSGDLHGLSDSQNRDLSVELDLHGFGHYANTDLVAIP